MASCSTGPSTPMLRVGLGDTPHQPRNISFPSRTFGKKTLVERSFLTSWYKKWKWLHYDISRDCVLCFICCKAVADGEITVSKLSESSFLSGGFTNWKDATTKFLKHERSDFHKQCNKALNNHQDKMRSLQEDISSILPQSSSLIRSHPQFTNDLLMAQPQLLQVCPRKSTMGLKCNNSVHDDQDKVRLNLKGFKPEEIDVKISKNDAEDGLEMVVECMHERKGETDGKYGKGSYCEVRHLIRRIALPLNMQIDRIRSNLTKNGILTIAMPKVNGWEEGETIAIPIQLTSSPSTETSQNNTP